MVSDLCRNCLEFVSELRWMCRICVELRRICVGIGSESRRLCIRPVGFVSECVEFVSICVGLVRIRVIRVGYLSDLCRSCVGRVSDLSEVRRIRIGKHRCKASNKLYLPGYRPKESENENFECHPCRALDLTKESYALTLPFH